MIPPTPENQKILNSLGTALAETLERERLIGQYVATWGGGKSVIVSNDASDSRRMLGAT